MLKGWESFGQVMGWRHQPVKAAESVIEDVQVSLCVKFIQKESRNLLCFITQRHHLHYN